MILVYSVTGLRNALMRFVNRSKVGFAGLNWLSYTLTQVVGGRHILCHWAVSLQNISACSLRRIQVSLSALACIKSICFRCTPLPAHLLISQPSDHTKYIQQTVYDEVIAAFIFVLARSGGPRWKAAKNKYRHLSSATNLTLRYDLAFHTDLNCLEIRTHRRANWSAQSYECYWYSKHVG